MAVTPVLGSQVMEFLPGDFQTEVEREARDKLAGLLTAAAELPSAAELVVRLGSVATEVIAEAGQWGADLIVVTSHQPKLSTYVLGSNATQIVRHATCSVLVLRT